MPPLLIQYYLHAEINSHRRMKALWCFLHFAEPQLLHTTGHIRHAIPACRYKVQPTRRRCTLFSSPDGCVSTSTHAQCSVNAKGGEAKGWILTGGVCLIESTSCGRLVISSLYGRRQLVGALLTICRPAELSDEHEQTVRGPPELSGPREGRGAILQRIWSHQRHQPQERLWICGKMCCIMLVVDTLTPCSI